jgi:hypothetical protein
MEDRNGCIVLGLDNLEARKVASAHRRSQARLQLCAAALLTPFIAVDVPQDVQPCCTIVQ